MKIDGLKVYTILKKQEKTQGKLSEAVGISRNTINGIINGRATTKETAEKIAAALGVRLEEITEKN